MRFFSLLLALSLVACAGAPRGRNSGRPLASTGLSCKPISPMDRERILDLANPKRFQKTNYHRGPRFGHNIEREADCSSFVHEIYHRAGLEFAMRSSGDLVDGNEFEKLREEEAMPGDLMVFHGHVGIVAKDGAVISATRVYRHRKRIRPSAIVKLDKTNFRGPRYVLRYRCGGESVAAE